MPQKQQPAADRFLVRAEPGDEAQVRRALEELGEVGPGPEPGALVVRLKRPGAGAHENWEEVVSRVGSCGWVAPVLVDASGGEHLPAGEVTVRFRKAPSEAALRQFAERARLAVLKRNEFVPEQVSFRPADPGRTYLPELVDALDSETEVASAWASTWSRYKRE